MTGNVSLFAFGTFGNPNGFKQTFFDGDIPYASSIKTFDLNTNAIKLFPGGKLYAIRKEFVGSDVLISYIVYSYAREMNSDRSGTFIGCGLAFINAVPNTNLLVSALNEIHDNLSNSNLKENVFQVVHSKDLKVKKSGNYDQLTKSVTTHPKSSISFPGDKKLSVYCSTEDNKLSIFFQEAMELLNDFDTIYFTGNKEIVEFVAHKRVYKLIQEVSGRNDWQSAINEVKNEKERKRQKSISEFQREIDELKSAKQLTLEEYKKDLDNVRKVYEDAERILNSAQSDMNSISQYYEDLISKSNQLFNNLRNSSLERQEVLDIHAHNKKLFNEGLSALRKPQYKTTVQKPNPRKRLTVNEQREIRHYNEAVLRKNDEVESKEENNLRVFQIATFISLLLLVGTWIYIINSRESEVEPIRTEQEKLRKNEVEKGVERTEKKTPSLGKLDPVQTGKLSDVEWRAVAKKIKKGQSLEEVVDVIFSLNPTDISKTYEKQKKDYGSVLFEQNKSSFKQGGTKITYIEQDSIQNIPCYKINK